MKLTAAACYALAAATQLSHDAKTPPIPCRQLAKAGAMPDRFLLQILRRLVDVGILRSARGISGGYHLARPAAQINVAEIVEAIDGPIVEKPNLPDGLTASSARKLTQSLCEIGQETRDRLTALRLSDLQESPSKRLVKTAG